MYQHMYALALSLPLSFLSSLFSLPFARRDKRLDNKQQTMNNVTQKRSCNEQHEKVHQRHCGQDI